MGFLCTPDNVLRMSLIYHHRLTPLEHKVDNALAGFVVRFACLNDNAVAKTSYTPGPRRSAS